MHFEYSTNYQDYRDAQRLFLSHRRLAALYFYFWAWVLPLIGLLICLRSVFFRHEIDGYFAFGVWCLAIPLMRFVRRRSAWKKTLPPNLAAHGTKAVVLSALEFNDSQIAITQVGRVEERYFWSALTDYAEDERIALLFIAEKQFLFIPKRAMPEDGWQLLRNLIAKREVQA